MFHSVTNDTTITGAYECPWLHVSPLYALDNVTTKKQSLTMASIGARAGGHVGVHHLPQGWLWGTDRGSWISGSGPFLVKL